MTNGLKLLIIGLGAMFAFNTLGPMGLVLVGVVVYFLAK